jgi:Ala-tRNA(Pro) deacylase
MLRPIKVSVYFGNAELFQVFIITKEEAVMPVKKLKEFLDQKKIKYMVCLHSTAYTAQEIAAVAHIPGKDLAKTVIVKLDEKMAMAVLTASDRIDLDRLREVSQARKIELASEDEFKAHFPDCEVGAMPPFGNLYNNMEVYVDEKLAADKEIAFNAGSHRELIKLPFDDFRKLVGPKLGNFTQI